MPHFWKTCLPCGISFGRSPARHLSLLGALRLASANRPTQIHSLGEHRVAEPIAESCQHTGRNTQRPQKVKMTIVFRANDTGAASLAPIKRRRPRNVFQGPLGELVVKRLRR
jgi:hypothetical protein